jgi:hypothetical protein
MDGLLMPEEVRRSFMGMFPLVGWAGPGWMGAAPRL